MQRRRLYSGSPINQTVRKKLTQSHEGEGKILSKYSLSTGFPYFMVNSLGLDSARKGANLGTNIVIITRESTALFINVPGNGLPYLADDVVN